MKLFYGIVLVLMVLVSACAQQAAEEVPVTEPEPIVEPAVQPEVEAEGTGAAVAEVTSNEIRSVGAAGFDPDELTISAGSAVTWINDDEKAVYIIIFKDGKSYLNIPRINSGQQIEHEFTEPGEYEYWQNIAFGVVGGKITVE